MKNIAVPRLSVIGAAKQSQCYFYFHVFIFIHEENGLSGGWQFLRESGHLQAVFNLLHYRCHTLPLILTHQDQHQYDQHDHHEDDHHNHHEDDHQDQHKDDKHSHPQLPGVHGYWASTREELLEEPVPR